MASNRFARTGKYLILGLCIALFILVQAQIAPIAAQTDSLQQARVLTQQGKTQRDQGRPEAAIQSWQKAERLYHQLRSPVGVAGSLINQSLALVDKGQLPNACSALLKSLKLDLDAAWLCGSVLNPPPKQPMQVLKQVLERPAGPSPVTLLGLQELGNVLRLLGELEESELVLRKALTFSQQTSQSSDVVRLSLGDTEQTFYTQLRDRYSTINNLASQQETLNQLQRKALASLECYRHVIDSQASAATKLQARLNSLGLLLDAQHWSAQVRAGEPRVEQFQAQVKREITPLLEQVLQTSAAFTQLPPAQSAYARLTFALHLAQFSRQQYQAEATQFALQALQTAQALKNQQLESYSLGQLAQLTTSPQQAQTYLEQALHLAESVPEIAYQWQHKLGQLHQQRGQIQQALQKYQDAIDNLAQVRGNLSSINPDLQFSFRDQVEPVYREYIQLLLENPNTDLEKVIQANERLQLAELENFLQCGRLELASLDEVQASTSEPPAVVHVISTGERFEVIVRSPNRSVHRYSPDAAQFRTAINNLVALVQDPDFQNTDIKTIQSVSQPLYQLMLAPAREKGYIPATGTLVFDLDGSLQNLPMSLLYDGQDYLIRHYDLSVALGSHLQQPQRLKRDEMRTLIAGLSQSSPSFSAPNAPPNLAALPQVMEEVADIGQHVKAEKLLNEDFTIERLQAKLKRKDFPIVHLTTHGQFSSDPNKTVILDWDQVINVDQLKGLLKGTRALESNSLELLVLSACETAKGDKRSALGLAGVAVQAGARSTVASLWQVNTNSTAQLMGEFYKHLSTGTKTAAIRQAQLALLDHPEDSEWSHPYYWSSFILVGGWL